MSHCKNKHYLLLIFISFISFPTFSAKPTPPVISLLKNDTTISILWEAIDNSQSYQLFYAPFPYQGTDTIENIKLGNIFSVSADLHEGDAFYITVVANNSDGSSEFSNIELFFISSPTLDANAIPITQGNWFKPNVTISWQWQLNGVVNESYPVELYDIDLFDSSEALIKRLKRAGKKVICYFSAGSYENFRSDKNKFSASERGEMLDGWPNEQWLDIRSNNVANIMSSRLDTAVLKGCDGVEPDNMDGYLNNSGFNLTAKDQLAFNKFIANEAHKRGLSVGLKNDLEQIEQLVEFFDFSVNEQCHEFDECETLTPFIQQGKPVLHTEYQPRFISDENARNQLCQTTKILQFNTLVLPLDLNDQFRISCTD